MSGANGTGQFWSSYAERNGYYSKPSTGTTGDLEIRMTETEGRVEVACDWLLDLMDRVAALEARVNAGT